MKTITKWIIGLSALGLVLACAVGAVFMVAGQPANQGMGGPVQVVGSAPSPSKTVASKASEAAKKVPVTVAPAPTTFKAPPPSIGGDDLVHVGEDVPAGTYRVIENVAGMDCYWSKSKDAEGSDIIDNDIPSGGRPQVTLKKGQWFTSSRCPLWVKK